MDISTAGSSITLKGTIKSISDFQNIKNEIDSVIQTYSSITIIIPDSISITSAVIGYFTKLKLKDNIAVNMHIGDERLYRLLKDLHLVELFNAIMKK
jgi:hypothetical protein